MEKVDLCYVCMVMSHRDYLDLCDLIDADTVVREKAMQRHIPAAKRAFEFYSRLRNAFHDASVVSIGSYSCKNGGDPDEL